MSILFENLRLQLDEVEALRSIYGDDFCLDIRCGAIHEFDTEIDFEDVDDEGIDSLRRLIEIDELEYENAESEVTRQKLLHKYESIGISYDIALHLQLPEKGCHLMVFDNDDSKHGIYDSEDDSSIPRTVPVAVVQHIQPIVLHISTQNANYPAKDMPKFSLSAPWIDDQKIKEYSKHLSRIWEEQERGVPMVFCWTDFLLSVFTDGCKQGETLPEANILVTESANSQSQKSATATIQLMVEYNAMRKSQLFRNAVQHCNICYEEALGTAFFVLECSHFFCKSCMSTQVNLCIDEGDLESIKCSDTGCRRLLQPHEIKSLVSAEAFERWEDLTLKRALDRMADASYCPRCGTISLEDLEENCADCPKCFFVFCTLCEEGRHPGVECVGPETRLAILKQKAAGGGKDAVTELRRKEQEYLNLIELEKFTKPCPTCGMAIERTEGCNKMTCVQCGSFFCYKCGSAIRGYNHFKEGSTCILFDEEEILRWERRWEEQAGFHQAAMMRHQLMGEFEIGHELVGNRPPREENNLRNQRLRHGSNCPNCGQFNYKVAGNNHMHCWSCTVYFCARCRAMLHKKGGAHFGPNGCPQHG